MLDDIFSGLLKYYEGDYEQALETMRDLYFSVKYNPNKYTNNLEDFIIEESQRYNLCPNCGHPVHAIEKSIPHTELDERLNEYYDVIRCDNCGWQKFA